MIVVKRAEWDMDHRAAFWDKRQEGLGREYLLHLRDEFSRLLQIAESGSHSRPFHSFHRFFTRRFSAQVFYEVDQEILIVYAVFDCRENPAGEDLDTLLGGGDSKSKKVGHVQGRVSVNGNWLDSRRTAMLSAFE